MPEISLLKKVGNSIAVYLDRGVIEKVYGLKVGDPIEINYKFPKIILNKCEDKKCGKSNDDKKE
jgi:antitoxin component of MazEF toxin-antitoxin module